MTLHEKLKKPPRCGGLESIATSADCRTSSTNETMFSAGCTHTAGAGEAYDDRRNHGEAVLSVAGIPHSRQQHRFHVSLQGEFNLSNPIMRVVAKSTP